MAQMIAYFSRAGNNYVNGQIKNLSIGNTEIAAKMIQEQTKADLFKIDPIVPYSSDYSVCIEEARQDQMRGARPELKRYPEDLNAYDVIYLGYPNYWGTMPMAVFTFLEKFDFSGKTIRPFCTHEGSGMGSSKTDISRLCPGAVVKNGLELHGARVTEAKAAIRKWLQSDT